MKLIRRSCPICNCKNIKLLNGQINYTREFGKNGPTVIKCKNCDLIYLNPIMSEKDYDEFYNFDGQKKFVDGILKEDYNKKLDLQAQYRFLLLKNYLNNKDLLDVGCGYSKFLTLTKSITKNYYGLEPSIKRAASDSNIFCGKIEDWEKKVDIITCFQVLEHVLDLNSFIKCVKELLNDGGKLAIEVPNHDDILVGLNKYKKFYYQNAHCSYFTEKTIGYFLDISGFKIDRLIKLQRYSLDNHLKWLIGKDLKITIFNRIYNFILRMLGKYDTIFIIASKK